MMTERNAFCSAKVRSLAKERNRWSVNTKQRQHAATAVHSRHPFQVDGESDDGDTGCHAVAICWLAEGYSE